MSTHTAFDKRMKRYEVSSQLYLTRRTPVIIRIDGKAFHTFTRSFDKPFDHVLSYCMRETMRKLVDNIQGCVLGYTQSDEISLLLIDYKTLETEAWFDYRVDKLCSISASMATLYFDIAFARRVASFALKNPTKTEQYQKAFENGAFFDSRAFNIPREDVNNYFVWRQADCKRNALQSVCLSLYNPSELKYAGTTEMIGMIKDRGIDYEDVYDALDRYGASYISGDDSVLSIVYNDHGIDQAIVHSLIWPPDC